MVDLLINFNRNTDPFHGEVHIVPFFIMCHRLLQIGVDADVNISLECQGLHMECYYWGGFDYLLQTRIPWCIVM